MPSVNTMKRIEPNTNRFRPLTDELTNTPMTARQEARAAFKERQMQDKILSSKEDRTWVLGTRGGGKQSKPKGWAKREARFAEDAVKSGKAVRLGVRLVDGEAGETHDAAPLAVPNAWERRAEVNLVDLIQPGRVRRARGYAAEPARRPETIPGLLTPTLAPTSVLSLDDYLSLDEIPAELLAELFPSEAPVVTRGDESAESEEEAGLEVDEWEMAQISEFSFDEVSVAGAG